MKLATRQNVERPILNRFLAEAVEHGWLTYAEATALAQARHVEPFGRCRPGRNGRWLPLALLCFASGLAILSIALWRP